MTQPPSWIQRLWIQRVTGTSSILGSSLIIYMILSQRKLARPYHRIMILMSAFDIIQSIGVVVSFAAFPREFGHFGAKGNSHTCTAQAIIMVLGWTIPLYNCCLNIYYVLTIRYKYSSEQFARLEPILHMIAIIIPLSMAIILNTIDNAAPLGLVCMPRGKISLWATVLIFSFCFITCITSMICICWTVTSQANKMKSYSFSGRRKNPSARRSRVDDDRKKTIKQAFLYFSAFILTYFFPILGMGYTNGKPNASLPNVVVILTSIFYPLQGFWNFVFYIRPGIHRTIKINPGMSVLRAARVVIFNPTSIETSQRQSMGRRRSITYSFPTSRLVENIIEPVVISSPCINTSENMCMRPSSNEIDLSTKHQESPIVITISGGNESSEDSIKYKCGQGLDVQPQLEISPRSRVSIASVLTGADSV